jgi:hypothetical protein
MPAVQWALRNGRPVVEVDLRLASGAGGSRLLIADTGAGSSLSVFELVLDEEDCLSSGAIPVGRVHLGGAYSGSYPLYLVDVAIAALDFDEPVPAVGVTQIPAGFAGIAGFKFLSRFHFGNFGKPSRFGLDMLPDPG